MGLNLDWFKSYDIKRKRGGYYKTAIVAYLYCSIFDSVAPMVIMGFVIGLFLFLEMGQNSINHIVYLRGKTYLNQEYKKYSL